MFFVDVQTQSEPEAQVPIINPGNC